MDDIDRAGLLVTVMNCLESLRDVVRCSAVSKVWREATENTKPRSIHVSIDRWCTYHTEQNCLGSTSSAVASAATKKREVLPFKNISSRDGM